ncbi:unnamed protein product [Peniophora sp. CBMAI 1063]|nr:unnamed protein product [Peniophora sp. CBMAI 1063]
MDELDVKIRVLEVRLVELNRERNARMPIAVLPDEILHTIFTYFPPILPLPEGYERNSFSVTRPPTWFAITHTCHRWRTISCSSPLLWSNVTFGNFWFGWMFLQRSYPAPVDIALRPRDLNGHKWNAQAALNQFTRARSLKIVDSLSSFTGAEKIITSMFSCEAPLLENLHVQTKQYTWARGEREPDYLDLRTTAFFRGKHPALSSLTLKHVHVDWNTTLLSSRLTYLSIQDVAPDQRPSMNVLLGILAGLPELRQLDLIRCLPAISEATAPTVPSESRLKLQYLWRLRLHSNSPIELDHLTAHILIPLSAQYLISCEDIPLDVLPLQPDVVQNLSRCILHHVVRDGDNDRDLDAFHYMRLAGPEHTSRMQRSSFCWSPRSDAIWETPRREEWPPLADLNDVGRDPVPRVQVNLIWSDRGIGEDDVMARTRSISLVTNALHTAIILTISASLSAVRHVLFSGVIAPVAFSFSAGLPRARNVESLTVCGISALRTFCIINGPAQDFTKEPRSTFPRLNRIVVRDAHLDDHFVNSPEFTLEYYLKRILRERLEAGDEGEPAYRVEHLQFKECSGIWGRADLQPLAELVKNVEWDKLIINEEPTSDVL